MLSMFLRRAKHRAMIERLHAEIVAAARDPAFFTSYSVADSFEGRFEILTLHAWLVLRRLCALPPPGPEIAQDLTDQIFTHLDRALREIGIGDTSVPKRMRRLAEAFLGRCAAYDTALGDGGEALAATLSRNICDHAGDDAGKLTHYVVVADAVLSTAPITAFSSGPVPFPVASLVCGSTP
jgi:cytochrome b pre-mRNA-processing protein 3